MVVACCHTLALMDINTCAAFVDCVVTRKSCLAFVPSERGTTNSCHDKRSDD